MGSVQAWDHYEKLRIKYKRRPKVKVGIAERERKLAEMKDYLDWCAARDVPPLLFMEKRFEAMYRASHRMAIPRSNQLKSEKLAAVWGRVESTHYAQQQSDRLHEALSPWQVQVIRDLYSQPTPQQENVKRKNSANPDGCLALFRYSGGYHPKSGWCSQCTNQATCAQQLRAVYGFDVVALREGRFAQLPNHILHAALT